MQKTLRLRHTSAVSEIIGILLVFSIASTVIGGVLLWSGDRIDQQKIRASSDAVMTQLELLTETFEELLSQGANSSRAVNIGTGKGNIAVASGGTRVVLWYSVNQSFYFTVSGFDDDDDKFIITVESYNATTHFLNVTYLNGLYPFRSYDDRAYWFNNQTRNYEVKTNHPLVDALRIDISHWNAGCVGRIFVFDLGYLTYTMPQGYPGLPAYVANGGLISTYAGGDVFYNLQAPQHVQILRDPSNVYYIEFLIPILQIHPTDTVLSGPEGSTYRCTLRLNKTQVEEQTFRINRFFWWRYHQSGSIWRWGFDGPFGNHPLTNKYNFKIQFFGNHADIWTQYFADISYIQQAVSETASHGSEPILKNLFIRCDSGVLRCDDSIPITILHSLFDVSVEVV